MPTIWRVWNWGDERGQFYWSTKLIFKAKVCGVLWNHNKFSHKIWNQAHNISKGTNRERSEGKRGNFLCYLLYLYNQNNGVCLSIALITIKQPTLPSMHTYLHIDLLFHSYKLRPPLPTSYHPPRQKMEWVDRYPFPAWKSKHFLHHWLFKRPVHVLEGLTSENHNDHAQL
jgi:hypothetical protein